MNQTVWSNPWQVRLSRVYVRQHRFGTKIKNMNLTGKSNSPSLPCQLPVVEVPVFRSSPIRWRSSPWTRCALERSRPSPTRWCPSRGPCHKSGRIPVRRNKFISQTLVPNLIQHFTIVPIYLPTYRPTYLQTYQPTYSPTNLPTYYLPDVFLLNFQPFCRYNISFVGIVKVNEGSYRPNCQTNIKIVLHELTLLFWHFTWADINLHLHQIKSSTAQH